MPKFIVPRLGLLLALGGCGQSPSDPSPAPPAPLTDCRENCTEIKNNSPVENAARITRPPPATEERKLQMQTRRLPEFQETWGLKKSVYEEARKFFEANQALFLNLDYATIIDMSQHSSRKRFFLFDLKNATMRAYKTAHGVNSDPDKDGFADQFSNEIDSYQTALGPYMTMATYQSPKNGESLIIHGFNKRTNDNSVDRATVVHGASYVNDSDDSTPGTSEGCPALDHRVTPEVIAKIKGGSFLHIGR
jgi:hypothetical protein